MKKIRSNLLGDEEFCTRMRRLPLWAVVCVGVLLLGCSGGDKAPGAATGGAPIAVVNGEGISRDLFEKEMVRLKKKFGVDRYKMFTNEELVWLKTNALNRLIQEILYQQQAAKNGIQVTREEFDEEVQKVKLDYEEDSFERYLQMENISLEDWYNQIKNNLLIKNLIHKAVNSKVSIQDDELIRYFNSHGDEFLAGERIRALHIVVETEEEARGVFKDARSGKKDFSDLARRFSVGAEKASGGDIGYFEPDQMPEEFEPIIKLNKGETSNIIRTPYGYHIFKIVDKLPKQKRSFQEAKKSIYDKLLRERQEEEFQKWIYKIKDEAKIEINNELLDRIG
jgi:parvulin-like peptidyl-prolyl isomerase